MRRAHLAAAANNRRAAVDPDARFPGIYFRRQISTRGQLRYASLLVPDIRYLDESVGIGAKWQAACAQGRQGAADAIRGAAVNEQRIRRRRSRSSQSPRTSAHHYVDCLSRDLARSVTATPACRGRMPPPARRALRISWTRSRPDKCQCRDQAGPSIPRIPRPSAGRKATNSLA